MLKGVLCSTGALITRFNGRDPGLLREFWPHIEADGLEFMIYPSWDGRLFEEVAKVESFKREQNVKIPVLHADKRIGELLSQGSDDEIKEAGERFIANCLIAERLGAELMVLHLWGGPASDGHIERNIDVLGNYMRTAERHGLLLTVENVICGGKTPLVHMRSIMDRYSDAVFTVDTKMAEFHLELPETLADDRLWDGRVRHLHVNDYGGGLKDFNDLKVRHIGEGHVDFPAFFRAVKARGYRGWATVESTSVRQDGTVDFEKLNRSLNAVRRGLE